MTLNSEIGLARPRQVNLKSRFSSSLSVNKKIFSRPSKSQIKFFLIVIRNKKFFILPQVNLKSSFSFPQIEIKNLYSSPVNHKSRFSLSQIKIKNITRGAISKNQMKNSKPQGTIKILNRKIKNQFDII